MPGGTWGKLARVLLIAMAGVFAALVASAPANAAGFGEGFLLSGPPAATYGTQQSDVVARGDGSFVYAWVKDESDDLSYLEAVVVAPDGSMGPVQMLDSAFDEISTADIIDAVSLSAGPSGQVHVAWTKIHYVCSPGCVSTTSIRYVNLDEDGSADGTPATVQTLPAGHSSADLGLATSGTGRTGVLYNDYDGSTAIVLMAIAIGDDDPLAPFQVNTTDWDGIQYLDIAGSANGSLFPVWSGYPDGSPTLETHGLLVKGDGAITPDRQMLVGTSSLDEIEARIDGTGRASAFAVDYSGNQLIRMRQLDPDGALIGAGSSKLTLDAATDALPGHPYTAIAEDGTITTTFLQPETPSDDPSVWTRTISPTGALGTPVEFLPGDAGRILHNPSIGTGPDGSGFMTWWEEPLNPPESDHFLYRGRPMAAGGTPTGSVQLLQMLQSSPVESPDPQQTAFSAEGNGAALWSVERQEMDYADELHAAMFDGAPPKADLWVPQFATAGQEIVMAVDATDSSPLTYEWKVDGSTLDSTGPLVKHTFSTAGTSEVEVRITDSFGNETNLNSSVTVNSPSEPPTPPNTQITGKPAKKTKSKTATFKFISSLAGSKFECRLDKAGWTDCKSPVKLKKLKPGKHTFKVRAIKGELIDKTPASYGWTVQKAKKKKQK